jgi:hypothetical protein
MCPAELPPGEGSTTALAVAIVQRLPAPVRDPVEVGDELPDEVGDALVVVLAAVEVLGAGVGVGGVLLHAPSAAARPTPASTTHTERAEPVPCVVTPPT